MMGEVVLSASCSRLKELSASLIFVTRFSLWAMLAVRLMNDCPRCRKRQLAVASTPRFSTLPRFSIYEVKPVEVGIDMAMSASRVRLS